MSSSSEDAKKWKHRLRKKRERTAEVLAELKRVRHDVHAERRALADAAETIKLETISKAAAHRRAAEEHRADLERVRAQLRQREEEHADLRRQLDEQREAQAAKREDTEREYKARLDPVRAENERMTAKAREHGLV